MRLIVALILSLERRQKRMHRLAVGTSGTAGGRAPWRPVRIFVLAVVGILAVGGLAWTVDVVALRALSAPPDYSQGPDLALRAMGTLDLAATSSVAALLLCLVYAAAGAVAGLLVAEWIGALELRLRARWAHAAGLVAAAALWAGVYWALCNWALAAITTVPVDPMLYWLGVPGLVYGLYRSAAAWWLSLQA